MKVSDPLLDIAKKLEEAALQDSYFVERKLYPNVDFYSGIIMRAIGIPVEMFTVIFAIGRMPGWIANYREVARARGQPHLPAAAGLCGGCPPEVRAFETAPIESLTSGM